METKNTLPRHPTGTTPSSPKGNERANNSPSVMKGWRGTSRGSIAGFTLVELIVVITILVILGTIAFVSLWGFSGSARDSSRVSDLSLLSKGLDIYYARQGSYPSPTGSVTVTYSGAAVWYQGTAGDSVVLALWGGGSKISKRPVDPLLSTEYTYSLASELREYSLAASYEGNSVALDTNTLRGGVVYAETENPAIVYIKGTYNGVAVKVSTGSKVNLLAVPSIITSSWVLNIIAWSQTGFLVHGSSNSWGLVFVPKLVYSSGALPNNDTDRIAFASGVVSAYSGTSLASNGNIAQFISASSSTGALASIGGNFVSTKLGGSNNAVIISGDGSTPNSCATNPSFANLGTLTVGSPTSVEQEWVYSVTPGNCTYVCTNGFTGSWCIVAPPIVAYSPTNSTTTYITGMWFTYAWATVTVTNTGVGVSSTKYPGTDSILWNSDDCNTSDIVIWRSDYNPQIWSACNAWATIAYTGITIPNCSGWSSDCISVLRLTLGGYYQWGRNDNISAGTFVASQWWGAFTSPANTTGNSNFYQGLDPSGDWRWWGGTPAGWNISNGGNNQWPCANGYHIPTNNGLVNTDWPMAAQIIVGTTTPSGTPYDTMRSVLNLPLTGYRKWSDGAYFHQGVNGYYWSSSPTTTYSYSAAFPTSGWTITDAYNRGYWFSIRCIRN